MGQHYTNQNYSRRPGFCHRARRGGRVSVDHWRDRATLHHQLSFGCIALPDSVAITTLSGVRLQF